MNPFNWTAYSDCKQDEQREEHLREYFADTDNVDLTDILSKRKRGAGSVLRYIEHWGKGKTAILKPLRKRDGSPYKPGDKVEWVRDTHNRKPLGGVPGKGRKVSSAEMQDMIMQGEDDCFTEMGSAIVDKNGFITIPVKDAVSNLYLFGVHHKSGKGICNKPEFRKRVTKDIYGKVTESLRWNWLFKEVFAADVEKAEAERTEIEKAEKKEKAAAKKAAKSKTETPAEKPAE